MGAGCVEVEVAPPLVIRGAARASVENGQCSWSIEQPSPLRAEGVLDLAFKTSYFFSPLFEGTVEFAHERQSLLPDPDFMIERYLVEAREGTADGPLLRGPDVVNPLTVHRSVQIEAPPSGGRGRGVDVFVALTDPMGAALYESLCVGRGAIVQPPGRDARCPVPQFRPELTARVVLRVRAFGQQRDGVRVETPPFDLPITVCCGCLRRAPETIGAARCEPAMSAPSEGYCVALQGQDEPVDCALCAARLPAVCQPYGFSPAGGVSCGP
jgi:hypothetical protein